MARKLAWLMMLLALGALPAAHAFDPLPPAERAPATLSRDLAGLRDALDNLSREPDRAAIHYGAAVAAHELAAPYAGDLDPQAAELLANYWESLAREQPENLTNMRALARAASRLLDQDLLPRAEAWARVGTFVTPGLGEPLGGGVVRVPVLLFHPPPGGVGAFDVRLRVDPISARPVEAASAAGEGEAVTDPANGTARIGGFDARALAGAGTTAGGFLVLGSVDLAAASPPVDDLPVTLGVDAIEVVDRNGEPVPVVTPDGFIILDAAHAASKSPGVPARFAALAAVSLLALVAVVAAHKFLKT